MSPIDCKQVLQQIELYLDGELDPAMGSEVGRHLGACSPCMDHADFKRHLRELLKAKCGCGQVPAHVLERIRTVLGEEPDRPAGV
ncbi:MAG TPA: mycothiol system anti-sigma-R factor [Actinomycetota bacterium]